MWLNHIWCNGKGRLKTQERCRALSGLAAPLRPAPGTGRAEQRHGDTPPQQGPWPNAVGGTTSRGKLVPLPRGKDRRECSREAERPSSTERASLHMLEASNSLFEGLVLPLVLVALLTCRPASSKTHRQAASALLWQLQTSTQDSSSLSERHSQGGDPK